MVSIPEILTMGDDSLYSMNIEMDKEQLIWFYTTMDKSLNNWPGGEPIEQELLKYLKEESWKLLLEAQFQG